LGARKEGVQNTCLHILFDRFMFCGRSAPDCIVVMMKCRAFCGLILDFKYINYIQGGNHENTLHGKPFVFGDIVFIGIASVCGTVDVSGPGGIQQE
jgi:hypothetical protein